jgi:rubrerythrin
MDYTGDIARNMGVSRTTVNLVAGEIGVRGDIYGDYPYIYYEIKNKDVPQLKLAVQIVEKDEYFLQDKQLKLAVQIVEKYKYFLEDIPKLKLATQIVEKDKAFLQDEQQLKLAVQIVEKDEGFLEDIPKLKLAVQIVEKDKDFLQNKQQLKLAVQIVEKDEKYLNGSFGLLDMMSFFNKVYSQNLEELEKLADLVYKHPKLFLEFLGSQEFSKNNEKDGIIEIVSLLKTLEFFEANNFTDIKVIAEKFREIYQEESFIDTLTFELLPKYKIALFQKLESSIKEEIENIKNSFDENSPFLEEHLLELQEKYPKFSHLAKTENSENSLEILKSENQSLKSQLSELQAKLDKIEKEKLETAEIVARIAEKYLK